MKNKNLFLRYFLGSCVFFTLFIVVSVLFRKWNLFGFQDRLLGNIIVEALIVSSLYSVIMFFYTKNILKKRHADK
jgi:hypothetical protein